MTDSITDTTQPTKRCSKCGEMKPITEFHKHVRCKNGLRPDCKACRAIYYAEHRDAIIAYKSAYRANHLKEQAAYDAAYYAKHIHEKAAYNAKWREEHREEIVAYGVTYHAAHRAERATYRAEHRDERKALAVSYYAEHREEIAAYTAAWQKANPDKMRAKYHRRRARKAGNGGTHTADDIQRQGDCQKWKCWWCGEDCSDKYHVDHIIPLAKGGHNNPSNIVITCPYCNQSKHDKLPDEWAGRLL